MKKSIYEPNQNELKEKLQLFISCRNLTCDSSTVNSFLVIKLAQMNLPSLSILKTPVYENQANPNYAETTIIHFYFEVKQRLIFEIYQNSEKPKLIGCFKTSVSEIFGSPYGGLIRELTTEKGNKVGHIIVRISKIDKQPQEKINFKFSARNLPAFRNWFFISQTSSYFKIIHKRQEDQLQVYRSEKIEKSQTPSWEEFQISQNKLCKKNPDHPIQIRFFHHQTGGNHIKIGSVHTSLSQIKTIKTHNIEDKGKIVGELIIEKVMNSTYYQFGKYIQSGLELNLVACIDFTASNHEKTNPKSLHYISKGPSQYEKVLDEVLQILIDYDYDKQIPTFGFGAKGNLPQVNMTLDKVSHCFPLNLDKTNPNIYGKKNIIKAYRDILKKIQFHGPTYFGKLFDKIMPICKTFKVGHSNYMILLIITDGILHDMQQVIDKIVACCNLPLSIIIVGVGDADFTNMNKLDSDDAMLVDSKGIATKRDIVQFVQFNKCEGNSHLLARQVLAQLPKQVEQYFFLNKISPNDLKGKKDLTDEFIQKFIPK